MGFMEPNSRINIHNMLLEYLDDMDGKLDTELHLARNIQQVLKQKLIHKMELKVLNSPDSSQDGVLIHVAHLSDNQETSKSLKKMCSILIIQNMPAQKNNGMQRIHCYSGHTTGRSPHADSGSVINRNADKLI